ncbi:hypothetical protein P879_10856 [Paragonimus westermani]|uniref:Uncharacterized protein n=1 Tax=Paragonimus westermani TaxID=34504 RepID=A0A8T0DBZ2_9TREM|nr:hypothetical protein P879_10856 [Paragonimus westermani]
MLVKKSQEDDNHVLQAILILSRYRVLSAATLAGNEKLLDPHLDRVARQFLSGQDVPVTELRTPVVLADTSVNCPPNHDSIFKPSPTALRRDAPTHVNSFSVHPNRLDDEDKYKRRVAFSGIVRTFKYVSLFG